MELKQKLVLSALLGTLALPGTAYSGTNKEITLIHMGDLHGHLIPRPNLRSDGDGKMEGGLARMLTEINAIRDKYAKSLLINTGDTTQGSGEALYTEGQAMLDVVDMFGIDAFAPGNWEYVYGPDRFKAEFGPGTGDNANSHRWGALAGNLYNTAPKDADGNIVGATSTVFASGKIPATLPRVHTAAEYDEWANWYVNNGTRILPPYTIRNVDGVSVGIVGCTTRRGPQVVGKWVTEGIEFSDCTKEVPKFVAEVRSKGVDMVVLITEIEVGANIEMVRSFDVLKDPAHHIDVILNSDMHEETVHPIVIPNADNSDTTLLIEEGQDGTMIGELVLTIADHRVTGYTFTPHRIHDGIAEHPGVAKKVEKVRAPFTTGFDASILCNASSPYWSKLSESCLVGPLDEVVGTTVKALHRSGFTDEAAYSDDPDAMPAVIEGSSHDWIADAIRWWAHSDLATVRGFRYGTHVKSGPITRNDLYHFVPIAARIGKAGKIHANQLRNQVDNSSLSVFSTSPLDTNVKNSPYNNEGWAGGWMFAYSGPQLSFDPYWVRRGPEAPQYLNGPAYPGDSRSRGITVTLPCDRLPSVALTATDPADPTGPKVSEKTACEHGGTGSAVTMINRNDSSDSPEVAGRPGDWTSSWAANKYAITNDNNDIYHPTGGGTVYRDLVIDEKTGDWSSKAGPWNHNKFHHSPVIEVAGYYYARAPYTLNNCPNCNPRGYSNVVAGDDLAADAPYLLPVNMNPDTGRAWLDDSGRPMLETVDSHTKWENGHPVVAGTPIDLTVVLEKYLNANPTDEVRTADDIAYDNARGRGPANPVSHRVTLKKELPGREFFGFPVMQPLCGVVASYFRNPPARIMPSPDSAPPMLPCPIP